MNLSKTGWSNDLPDAPGWYMICHQKEWDWWPGSMWPYVVRVDYVEGNLMVVEDPEQEHADSLPATLEYDGTVDQGWMRRAYKPLRREGDFDDKNLHDIPDVTGLPS